MAAGIAQWLFRRALKIFLREVVVLEASDDPGQVARVRLPNLKAALPTLLIANHPNGLIDGLIVYCTAGTTIRSVVKSTLWNQPLLRPLLALSGAVPVKRKQDQEEIAQKQHKSGDKLKTTDDAIDLVARALVQHTFIIFPEGISHSGAQMTPLKSGASRMLLSAAAYVARHRGDGTSPIQSPKDVSFQPVGLYFDDARTFRSRGLIHYGPRKTLGEVFDDGEIAEILQNPTAPHYVNKLTEVMDEELRALLPEAPSPRVQELTRRLSQLLYEANRRTRISDVYRWELVVKGILEQFKDLPKEKAAAIQRQVSDYYELLEINGLRDATVRDLDLGPQEFIARLRRNQIMYWPLAIFMAPLTLVGMLLYYVPYRMTGRIAFTLADGDVEVGTYKFLMGIIFFVLSGLFYTVVFAALAAWLKLTGFWWLVVFLLPTVSAFSAMIFTEKLQLRLMELKILLFPRLRKSIYQLGDQRQKLIDDLMAYL